MKLNILLLCNKPPVGNDANTIIDHIDAFTDYSEHTIWLLSNLGDLSRKLDLQKFDAIIIHYSLCILNNNYLSQSAKTRLRNYQGLKIIFVQDEYRQINNMISQLQYLDVDVLFTCFPDGEIERIYKKSDLPKVSKYNNLTGYIPERLLQLGPQPPIKSRPVHAGYRARRLSAWFGELGYEKWNIAEKWQEHTRGKSIVSDVSYHERDRIYGKKWIEFLSRCKATLGVESGSSVMDFTGELEKEVEAYELTHPHASFQEIQQLYFREYEGLYRLNQISPRCFEAIALKTALILYEGDYSGVLVPNRHYIVLKKDFSNMDDVLAKLNDNDYLQAMVDRAYEEVARSGQYSYQSFIHYVDGVISNEFQQRNKRLAGNYYAIDEYRKDIRHVSIKNRLFKLGMGTFQRLPPGMRSVIKGILKPKTTLKMLKKKYYQLK
ncbi:glycosyltransferase family 1 protein [Legionella taurinensis]|uniref:glycosyltransferase n=1 Tax=Legionella taurinensis TaxID=70611 RepID=UPI000E72BEE8|nr:glycosyltransferase [Legionella taurinensis]RJT67827.1 glycosyltransferase family 1 protein [Legionella taurinensis]